MFWGIVLKPNKKYTQVVKKSFHLSQISLDLSSGDAQTQVFVTTAEVKILLATLSKPHSHVAVDLVFSEGENISFHTQGGNGTIHLAGYFLDDEEDFGDFDGIGDEVDSEEEEEEEVPQLVDVSKGKKGKKLQEVVAAASVEDEEDSSDDDTFELGAGEEAGSEEDEDDDVGEEEDDDDDDDDDDDEDEEEEEVKEPKAKQAKLEKPKQNGLENGQKAAKPEKKQQPQQQQAKAGGEKTLSGNVKVVDLTVGKGDEAKSGKKVQVYYEGRLKTNNKVFDSSKQGNGFKFKLGQGEVIKAWDVGVQGMKVGGKRRITCPPHMAYGARGSPPVIPPNSTLVFEVELKKVL